MSGASTISNEDWEKRRERAVAKIDESASDLNILSQDIWSHPELNFEERHAHKVLTDFLEKEGFEVKRNILCNLGNILYCWLCVLENKRILHCSWISLLINPFGHVLNHDIEGLLVPHHCEWIIMYGNLYASISFKLLTLTNTENEMVVRDFWTSKCDCWKNSIYLLQYVHVYVFNFFRNLRKPVLWLHLWWFSLIIDCYGHLWIKRWKLCINFVNGTTCMCMMLIANWFYLQVSILIRDSIFMNLKTKSKCLQCSGCRNCLV